MSSRHLLEPITDQGIRSVKFFNGRVLPAEDLTQEQQANEARRRQLGRAIGEGVAYGFEVSRKDARVITVEAGLTINCRGHACALGARVDIDLVTAAQAGTAFTGGCCVHQDCVPPETGIYVAGEGLYLLLVSPATTQEGRAEVSGLGNEASSCNARYCVEGVQFRLQQITPAPELQTPAFLRNTIAYRCFGYPAQSASQMTVPSCGSVAEKYGLVDDLRPNLVTCCEVPIALMYLTASTGIVFIDLYAVRRRIARATLSHRWNTVMGDRRFSEGEAVFLQFQDHLTAIAGEANVQLKNIRAADRFKYLPAAGYLSGGTTGFDWSTFLGPLAPATETLVDASLLRSILHQSFFEDPIAVDKTPRAAVSVYRDPAQSDCVLFARTSRGRILVTLNPVPPDFEVYAQQGDCQTRYCPFTGTGPFMLDLLPGDYDIYVTANGYESVNSQLAHVVGGEQVDLSFSLTALTITGGGSTTTQPGPSQCVKLKDGARKGMRLCMVKRARAQVTEKGAIQKVNENLLSSADIKKLSAWKKISDSALAEWLTSWRTVLEKETKLNLRRTKPYVVMNSDFKTPQNQQAVPQIAQAFAVFDTLVVGLLVNDPHVLNGKAIDLADAKISLVTLSQIQKLEKYDIRSLDQLAGAWAGLVATIENKNTGWAQGLIFDAIKAVADNNKSMAYYHLDETEQAALRKLKITDDVGLANADVKALGAQLGSEGAAYRLITQAREIVPSDVWSLEDLGLSEGNIDELAAQGVESQGDFVAAAADEKQSKVLSSIVGEDDKFIQNLSLTAITTMTAGAISLLPEVNLLSLPGVNEGIAEKLAAANIGSTTDLAAANAAEIATKTGLAQPAVENIINAAKSAARSTATLASLSILGRQAATLKSKFGVSTLSDLTGKSASDIAAAFGGSQSRAAAVIAGAKLALGKAALG
jgi:hypothetical protein